MSIHSDLTPTLLSVKDRHSMAGIRLVYLIQTKRL